MIKRIIFLFLVATSCSNIEKRSIAPNLQQEIKSFESLKIQLRNRNISEDSIEGRIQELTNDSLKNIVLFKVVSYFAGEGDSTNFRKWNTKTLKLSEKRADTSKIAESLWDLANFYYQKTFSDSAYYYYNHSYRLYEKVENEFLAGMMLLNMAIIQNNIKDYAGSELTTIRAIEKIKPLKRGRELYMAYNNLGIIYNELGEYEKSLYYHSLALDYLKTAGNPVLQAWSLNNVGVVLKNIGEYSNAVINFQKALSKDSLFFNDPELYAMLKDNMAHARLLADDTSDIAPLFFEALEIRYKISHKAGIVINKLHLGEYYLKKRDTLQAISYATQARTLARETRNFRDLQNSLYFLSQIDKSKSQDLLNDYIKINDSLQRKERAVRNKFARIQFETDEFIAENQYLNEQRKWIIGGSGGAIFMVLLVLIIWRQKARNKKLQLKQEQQKANEDIYNLLLDQENRIEEGRSHEKERISKELHDGVLGNMYGVRFSLSNLNSRYDQASIETKEKLLDRLRLIEEEIRFISRDLQKNSLLEEIGFLKILSHLMEDQEKVLGFQACLECDPAIEWDKINNKIKMNLYRVIQEAFQNIKKYAAASEASVSFGNEEGVLQLLIQDNGKGFDTEKKVRGIGLKNMQSRVKDLRGQIAISSGNSGTSINIKIPVKND